MNTKKKYIFSLDLDQIILKKVNTNYKDSKTIKNSIKTVNYLFNKDHIIKIFTSRFMGNI
jgi:hypothetical protein